MVVRIAGRRAALLPIMAVALVVSACTASEAEPDDGPSPSPTTDFVSGGQCPIMTSGYLPEGAGCVTTVEGTRGTLSVYALLDDDRMPTSWRVRLDTDIGAIDQRLEAGNRYSYPRAIGPADVNGDGAEDWWIKLVDLTGHGTPWQRAGVFVQVEDRLKPVTLDGEPLPINVGGITRMGEGATCRGGKLILLRAEAQNVRNTVWRYSQRAYEIDRTEARFLRRTEDVLRLSDYNDPALDRFYAIRCGDLHYPPNY